MKGGEHLSISYNWQYAMVGLTMSCCGAKAAVCLLDQARETRRKSSRRNLITAAGVVLGGVSFWGAGTILMAAMKLKDEEGHKTELQLNMAWVFMALGISLVSGLLAVQCGTRDSYFGMSKTDRVEMLQASLRKQQIGQLKANAKAIIMQKALLSRVHYVIGAGVFIGIGAEACDLILKTALYRDYSLDYNSGGLVLSLLFASATSIIAGWMLFRLNQWKEHWESLRVASTIYLGTLQTAIFFFNGLTMTMRAENDTIVLHNQLTILSGQVIFATVCCVMLTLSYAVYDMRLNIYHIRSQADEHYKQLRQLHDDIPLTKCQLQPGSVYLKSTGHSEVVKLELILMNIETYLARFTTVRDAWTEEFYQDPSLNIAGMVEEFIAKEKQILESAAARAQSGRRSSISPLVAAIKHIQQGNRLHHVLTENSDTEGAPAAGDEAPAPAAPGRRNSLFASAFAAVESRRRSVVSQIAPDPSAGLNASTPTNVPVITVVTHTTPTSPASSNGAFSVGSKAPIKPQIASLLLKQAQAQAQQAARSPAPPSQQQVSTREPQQPRPQQASAPARALQAAPPAPAPMPNLSPHPQAASGQPMGERQGSDPLARSGTLRTHRPPPLRASDLEDTDTDDDDEAEEGNEDEDGADEESDGDETSDDEA